MDKYEKPNSISGQLKDNKENSLEDSDLNRPKFNKTAKDHDLQNYVVGYSPQDEYDLNENHQEDIELDVTSIYIGPG